MEYVGPMAAESIARTPEKATIQRGQSMTDTPRATRRPDHLKPPQHWTNPPVPEPEPIAKQDAEEVANGPTRYGDWELKGIAIDF